MERERNCVEFCEGEPDCIMICQERRRAMLEAEAGRIEAEQEHLWRETDYIGWKLHRILEGKPRW